MAGRVNKRKVREENPNKSDSDDETYEDKARRPSRQRSGRTTPKKKKKASRRKARNDDSDDDIADSSEAEEDDLSTNLVSEAEPVELNPVTGRPRRSVRKRPVVYDDGSSDTDELAREDEVEQKQEEGKGGDEEDEVKEKRLRPRRGAKSEQAPKPTLTLKLKMPEPRPGSSGKRTRGGSVPGAKRGYSNEPQSAGVRRSGRLHPEDPEPVIALTTSGKHAEVVRPGTRSPEGLPRAAIRGGKSLPASAGSAIYEEDEDEDADGAGNLQELRPKNEDADEGAESGHGEDDGNGGGRSGLAAEEPPSAAAGPSGRQRVSSENGEGILSVEDSDPERAEQMVRSTSKRSLADDDQIASTGAVVLEHDQDKDAEAEAEAEAAGDGNGDDDDDDDEEPISNGRRRKAKGRVAIDEPVESQTLKKRRRNGTQKQSSDYEFNPEDEEDDEISASEHSQESDGQEELEELRRPTRKRQRVEGSDPIKFAGSSRLRRRKKDVDYRLIRPDLPAPEDMEIEQTETPTRRGRGGGQASSRRHLFPTVGPFGGPLGLATMFGGAAGLPAAGGAESDSSDDELRQRPTGQLGGVGMTPTTALGSSLLPVAQAHNSDPVQGASATTANLGKIKDRKALADADPLGVDQNITFDSVGGLQGHVNQLKEMVTLPLLYPEIFQRYHLTPPRGVLFHGPPGTGKTLLARALAATVSSQGQKITFYMRKGADALSKWVGEAERQLRLLFEEARANQPSIIFFDEIDGLAPVRSSKQEQIHASIVSTLLALMDGMDGRGQVVVIGATNRPDSVDPALRRPGRFDREFYFPLPNKEARRSILDIHTKEWKPPLGPSFKEQVAEMTKGYGGADLRALCTEAALNAVQRRYPQIYKSNEKLVIDPSTINVTPRDFFISLRAMVPSSERATSSGAAPLPKKVEPLLRKPLAEVQARLAEILPQGKKLTVLEEAEFEDYPDPDGGLQRERVQQDFETSRVFRPRLLIRGLPGMGQQYLANAVLNQFEGLHVQSFDLPTLLSDSTRSPEAAVVQLFAEVRRRKPSVIFIPNVDSWYYNVGGTVLSTFLSLLRTLAPTDPVLLLGIVETESSKVNDRMIKDLFGFSTKNQYELDRPDKEARRTFFRNVAEYIMKPPTDFPDSSARKKRKLEQLEPAPLLPAPKRQASREQRDAQKKKDRMTMNLLKLKLQPIVEYMKKRYRRFHTSIIEDDQIGYLYEEEDPDQVHTDMPEGQRIRPYERALDSDRTPGLRETATGRFFYNLNTPIIEERLANGFYMRPHDFLADVCTLMKDAKTHGRDRERLTKAKQLLAEVEVDVWTVELEPHLADCEGIYQREAARVREREERQAGKTVVTEAGGDCLLQTASNVATAGSNSTAGLPPLPPVVSTAAGLGARAQPSPIRTSEHSSLSNGFSNGPANIGDPHAPAQPPVAEADDGSVRPAAHVGMSQHSGPGTQRSQRLPLTAMPPGSQLEDFMNEASTTTSGKKTSAEHSSWDRFNTDSSNSLGGSGRRDVPDFSMGDSRAHGDSQLASTQLDILSSQNSGPQASSQLSNLKFSQKSSQQSSQNPSSHPPVPLFSGAASQPFRPSQTPSIPALLNNPSTPIGHQPPPPPQPDLVVDRHAVEKLHALLTDRTSGCSVEQLEQVNTALTDSIWKQRHVWNRTVVAQQVQEVFDEVMRDIAYMQSILRASVVDDDDDDHAA